jgi:Histidine kinase-like ATPase domain
VGPTSQQRDSADLGNDWTVIGHGQPIRELSQELFWALAEEPRLVVCDLTAMPVSAPDGIDLFAPILRYLADWPGVGVVVVTGPDTDVRAGLKSLPLPPTLVVSESRDAGLDELRPQLPSLGRVGTHLTARLSAPRTARRFTVQSLLAWKLMTLVAPASLVVSELVTNAVVHAASTVELALSRADGRLQMTVRDHGVGHPHARFEAPEEHFLGGRGLLLVQATTRGWGVFPARAEGKTVWAVFDAA